MSKFCSFLRLWWRPFMIIIVPLTLLPLALSNSEASKCGYCLGVMAAYWMLELLPIPVTSLMPLVLFPLLGILPAKEVSLNYFKDINFLLFGGLVMALAVESSELHKRIALRVLLALGSRPPMIMMAFAIVTAFLSMFLSNTATTALMVPIALQVLANIPKQDDENKSTTPNLQNGDSSARMLLNGDETFHPDTNPMRKASKLAYSYRMKSVDDESEPTEMTAADHKLLTKAIMLGICYSANVGGTGTLTGTAPNLVLVGQMDTIYPGANTGINYATWMAFTIPQLIVCLTLMWLWLQIQFTHKSLFAICGRSRSSGEDKVMHVLRTKYHEMGAMSFAEKSTLGWFMCLILLWTARSPRFVPGWGEWFDMNGKIYISDGTTAVAISLILFAWPRKIPRIGHKYPDSLVTWKFVQHKMCWGVIFIIGGSMALAEAVTKTGLSRVIGCQILDLIGGASPFVISSVLTIGLTFTTELTSNTATASVFLPIVIALAEKLRIHPLYFALPATIAPSFAFMLPVATAPNAIVAETGKVKTIDMMKAGFVMNWLCICMAILNMNTYGTWMFGLDTYPEWGNKQGNATNAC